MGCKRSFEVDLAGVLADPRAKAYAGFRDHYPRCPACSAEVRTWTELHAALGAREHPEAERLARYAELPAAERGVIDRHVAACASCRDELRLLGDFDPAGLRAELEHPASAREPGGVLRWLSGLVWQPAFAYGVALLVLVPVLLRTQGSEAPRAPEPSLAVLAGADRVEAEEAGVARPQLANEPPPAPGLAAAPILEFDTASAPERAPATVSERAPASASERAPAPAPRRADKGEHRALARARFGQSPPALPEVALSHAPERVAVRVPVPASARGLVEIRVTDASGLRSLVQHVEASPGRGDVAVELPRAWLSPGVFRVERRSPGPPALFTLTVR